MSRCRRKLKRGFRTAIKHLDGVLFGQPEENGRQRIFWGCATGVLLAYVFWVTVLCDIGIPQRYDGYAYIGLLMFLGKLCLLYE